MRISDWSSDVCSSDLAAGGDAVASCTISDRLSFAPLWTLVLTPEYTRPVTAKLDGFVRGLYPYTPQNKQDPNNPYDNVRAYGLLILYTGIRSHDGSGRWDERPTANACVSTGRIGWWRYI